jgi:hypothetical protein
MKIFIVLFIIQVLHSECELLASPTNIRQGCKCLPETYYYCFLIIVINVRANISGVSNCAIL